MDTEAANNNEKGGGLNSLRRSPNFNEKKDDIADLFETLHEKEHAIQVLQKELQSRDQELARSRERLVESRHTYHEEIEDQRKINRHLQAEIDKLKELFQRREKDLTPSKNGMQQTKENAKLKKEMLLQLERENQELNEELENAQENLKELEENLNETKAFAARHQNRAQTLEEELRARDSEIEKKLKFKEKEVESLRKKLLMNQQEMKGLVHEIEKQKTIAKENMDKINLMFK